jgi:anti-anti-sigma factor
MELKLTTGDVGIVRASLSGKLDIEGEQAVRTDFLTLVDEAASRNIPFVVDMENVTYLASLGIRLLFSAAKTLAATGLKLVILNPQPMVEETLKTSGTVRLIPIAHNEDEALQMAGA